MQNLIDFYFTFFVGALVAKASSGGLFDILASEWSSLCCFVSD
jgi:hypothetical protein